MLAGTQHFAAVWVGSPSLRPKVSGLRSSGNSQRNHRPPIASKRHAAQRKPRSERGFLPVQPFDDLHRPLGFGAEPPVPDCAWSARRSLKLSTRQFLVELGPMRLGAMLGAPKRLRW